MKREANSDSANMGTNHSETAKKSSPRGDSMEVRQQHSSNYRAGHSSSNSNIILVCMSVVFLILIVSVVDCHIKRTQYHEQGLHGPKSYKFGYTSGDHKNPQERHEVSDGHGHVKGWYSFIDATGKHQKVHYEAHPKYGFKVLNSYNSKAYNNGKRHYNS